MFGNPKNVIGMAGILTTSDSSDLDAIEASITKGFTAVPRKDTVKPDAVKSFTNELDNILSSSKSNGKSQNHLVSFDSLDAFDASITSAPTKSGSASNIQAASRTDNWNTSSPFSSWDAAGSSQSLRDSYKSSSGSANSDPFDFDAKPSSSSTTAPQLDDISMDFWPTFGAKPAEKSSSGSLPEIDFGSSIRRDRSEYSWGGGFDREPKYGSGRGRDDWSKQTMSEMDYKRDQIRKILDMDREAQEEFEDEYDAEEEIVRVTEQIDTLRGNLEAEGDVSIARVPEVKDDMTLKERKRILRILQIKNDRTRYCDFFEEIILASAHGIEWLCDGQRDIFGTKIDMTGYSDTVKIKLRRMRYDTGNFVGEIMKSINMSSGVRIVLELIPSMFLYSRQRKNNSKSSLVSGEKYRQAMQNIDANSTR